MTVATWLLARTSRIRIGTGMPDLPLHPTVEVAEEAALLQQASRGRLVLGVGAGYQVADFNMYGMDRTGRAQRLEQAMIDLRALWSGQPVAGAPLRPSLDDVEPPSLWLGAWSEAGVRRAAIHADGWIADPIRTLAEVAAMAKAYRAETSANGSKGHVVVSGGLRLRQPASGDGRLRAARNRCLPVLPAPRRLPTPERGDRGRSDLGGRADDRLLVGSPEEVASGISSLAAECGADTVVLGCAIRPGRRTAR